MGPEGPLQGPQTELALSPDRLSEDEEETWGPGFPQPSGGTVGRYLESDNVVTSLRVGMILPHSPWTCSRLPRWGKAPNGRRHSVCWRRGRR